MPHPDGVLGDQRLVEAELVVQVLDRFRRGVEAQLVDRRVARQRLDQQERQDRHGQDDRDQVGEFAEDDAHQKPGGRMSRRRSRADSSWVSARATGGTSSSMVRNVSAGRWYSRIGVRAMTEAERGQLSTTAISPMDSPGPISATGRLPTNTSAVPSTTR